MKQKLRIENKISILNFLNNKIMPNNNSDFALPVAFYFEIMFDNTKLSFKEVSGLETEIEMEEIAEGGNNYSYKVPKQVKHGNLVLKRALRTTKYSDVIWIRNIVEGERMDLIKPKSIVISLLNAEKQIIATWNCTKAFPIKWSIESLDAEKNSVLIENIDFHYERLIRQR